jgi:hypothetical protein
VTLSYEVVSLREGNQLRPMAVATCCRCGGTESISFPFDGNNPERVSKTFVRRGWQFDGFHKNRCVCPKCLASKAPNDPDELIRKREARMAVTPMPPRPAAAPQTASDDATKAVRDPTVREMRQIMGLLESHFDDKGGLYTKGWNDRRVAEEANLPMAMVSKVRREAFGELKVDTEIEVLRAEARELFERLVTLDGKINKLAEERG